MKPSSRLVMVVACSVLMACGHASDPVEIGSTEEMARVMEEYARLGVFSGTVLVARGGEVVYSGAFGEANKDHHVPNTLETRYNIGSIGKTFTGVAIMQLVDRGEVELNAPVSRYLDDFPYGDAITIHHLLSHTSGMSNYMVHEDYRDRAPFLRRIDDWLPLIYDQKLLFEPPGRRFAYSNSGIVVLGAVIERVTGLRYEDFIRTNILEPAGMTSTGINYPEDIVPNRASGYTRSVSGNSFTAEILRVPPASADGGIETTVTDMLAFDRALVGESLISAAAKEKMFAPNLADYGYCWRVATKEGRRRIGHGGGAPGVSASFMRYPDDDVTIIVLSNYTEGAREPAMVLEAITFGDPYGRPRPPLGEAIYRGLTEEKIDATADGVEVLISEGSYEIRRPFTLNTLGYELLGEGELEMAIAVFEVNLRRFPEDPNCYDSLAEAHLAGGDRETAMALYEKALEVDPTFENARMMLRRLKEGQGVPLS